MWNLLYVSLILCPVHFILHVIVKHVTFLNHPLITHLIVSFLSNRQATIGVWNAGKNNMGFGFDRQTWNLIKGCAQVSI